MWTILFLLGMMRLLARPSKIVRNFFYIKDLGPLKCFLGIEVARAPNDLFLSQQKYSLEIMDECSLLRSKPIDSLIEETIS